MSMCVSSAVTHTLQNSIGATMAMPAVVKYLPMTVAHHSGLTHIGQQGYSPSSKVTHANDCGHAALAIDNSDHGTLATRGAMTGTLVVSTRALPSLSLWAWCRAGRVTRRPLTTARRALIFVGRPDLAVGEERQHSTQAAVAAWPHASDVRRLIRLPAQKRYL
jgi:hypothetical protein